MLHKLFAKGDWFAPKRFGYGAGLPIAWQGWALIVAWLASLAGLVRALQEPSSLPATLAGALFALVTAIFVSLAAKRTRGGWKWRWGERD
ncbi:hypothetical protein I5E68_14585 [Novosphingobium sp. YJ-S2-02]|uniref:DUF4175 domain-containing protein n=1 Tax=Novosphingobium aureum TaxID=2792964 RepID=A0A931HE92_9SPHN|nr:hypothetical protein [Novosphingobium aureum]MBH0114169.1 hypothetical protein [Novosphingobium aureum]